MKNIFILSMNCISDDDVQVAIHRREDIAGWLRKLDHEGSTWNVVEHLYDAHGDWLATVDLTEEYRGC